MNNKSRIIDFVGHKKIYLIISCTIILIGIICNFIFGTTLDITFSGGSMVKYTYTGTVDEEKLKASLQEVTKEEVTFSISENLIAGDDSKDGYLITIQFPGNDTITTEQQSAMTNMLEEDYKDNKFEYSESNSVDATMGSKFFLKCLTAVAIACILMVLFVAVRFKRISGLSAGVTGLVALFHDIIIIYFIFVIFRMPIDSNFIAVVLMILGYSLNDTIVVYDRVRENQKLWGKRKSTAEIFNLSCSQVIKRTLFTSITTFIAIGTVYVVSIVFNLSSVQSFALPMMFGIISGAYSSICVAGPLWVWWQERKENAPAKEAKK